MFDQSKSSFGGRNPSPIAREVGLVGNRSSLVDVGEWVGSGGWLDNPNLNQYRKTFVRAHTCI